VSTPASLAIVIFMLRLIYNPAPFSCPEVRYPVKNIRTTPCTLSTEHRPMSQHCHPPFFRPPSGAASATAWAEFLAALLTAADPLSLPEIHVLESGQELIKAGSKRGCVSGPRPAELMRFPKISRKNPCDT